MNGKWVVLAAAMAAMAAMAATAAGTASFSKQVPVAIGEAVSISNIAGSVTITSWSRREVDIQGELESGVDRVDVRQNKSGVIIEVVLKESGKIAIGRNGDARLQVRVPEDVRLEVSTVSAPLSVSGVRGESRLKSVSGDILANFIGARIDAKTVSGSIRLNGTSLVAVVNASSLSGDIVMNRLGGRIEAQTTSGNVSIDMAGDVYASEVRANSVSGNISVLGGLAKAGTLEAQTVSGRVNIATKPEAGFHYDVLSFSGNVATCFGERAEDMQSPGGNRLSGSRGQGNANLRVKSLSGQIEICDH